MVTHSKITNKALVNLIRADKIRYGGNARLKIYGTLDCSSGKRMKQEKRVFFSNVAKALEAGFRPCARCMSSDYLKWKNGLIQS
jgi:methylphosphotriester-DNA--protein-cysteine methyltransferase